MKRKIKTQLAQTSSYNLTSLSIQQNWSIFDRHDKLPLALPLWRELTDSGKGWGWLILHLNHLNLLQLARQDHDRGLMNNSDLEAWVLKAKSWFQNLSVENAPQEEINEGRKVLMLLLKDKEGYPKEFRRWLRDSEIIPRNLFPTNL